VCVPPLHGASQMRSTATALLHAMCLCMPCKHHRWKYGSWLVPPGLNIQLASSTHAPGRIFSFLFLSFIIAGSTWSIRIASMCAQSGCPGNDAASALPYSAALPVRDIPCN
jgi:hypothetical protein